LPDADKPAETLTDNGPRPFRVDLSADEFAVGDFVGKFVLKQRLGAGGMGVVYLAERPDQQTGPVAIKVVKRGMDTEDVVRRFNRECDMLASLQVASEYRAL
jgi:serine/threonine protein kinase